MKAGEKVTYKKSSWNSQCGGHHEGEVKEGIIEEIFDSMDKTFKCLWIDGETELITEQQIIA